jgi:ABC-type transporter Mla MlaB component
MLRIETESDGPRIILRLIGRVRFDCLEELRQRVQNQDSVMVLDLAEVDLIDLQSVRFLCDCQDQKIELRNCAPYILEWIRRERAEGLKRPLDRRNLGDR